MKITGLQINKSNSSICTDFMGYTCSLFEKSRHELYTLEDLNSIKPSKFIKASDLLMLSFLDVDLEKVVNEIQSFQDNSVLFNKPILILTLSENPSDFKLADNQVLVDVLKLIKPKALFHFHLSNYHDHFIHSEIVTTRQFGKLIRMVNQIKNTHLKSEYKFDGFTCGIDPNRDYCGDAIEY